MLRVVAGILSGSVGPFLVMYTFVNMRADTTNGKAPVGSGTSRSVNQSMPSLARVGSNQGFSGARDTPCKDPASVFKPTFVSTIPSSPSRVAHICRMISAMAKKMGICANVQLIWPLSVQFHRLSKALVSCFMAVEIAFLACLGLS